MKFIACIALCSGLLISNSAYCRERQQLIDETCEAGRVAAVDHVTPVACYNGRTYRIEYVEKSTRIVLKVGKKTQVLHRIDKRFDPSLVGTDSLIGFMPDTLQPYKEQNILLYVSATRTSGGTGGGQCGSGSEIYLNFLDVSKTVPKVKSSILIGSCDYSIELSDQNLSDGYLGEIFVVGNKLSLQFTNYMQKEGYPIATISPDFKTLVFQ